MSSKKMSASNTSPLEKLLEGGVVVANERGLERGRGAFVEVIEEGWKVMDPSEVGLAENFAGVNFDDKLFVAPQDETRDAFMTRIHEVGHIVLSPHSTPADLELETGIPATVINAFEDGRINGHMMREVTSFAETMETLPFPINTELLKDSVMMAERYRDAGDPRAFSENEVRAFGACVMAASESYSAKANDEWESIADITGMSPEQKAYVIDVCHRLSGMTFEEMTDEINRLMSLLVDDIVEPPPPPPPPMGGDCERGVGPIEEESKGIDYEEEQSGTVAFGEYDKTATVTKVERPKPKPLTTAAKSSLERIGTRVAKFNPVGSKGENSAAIGAAVQMAASVKDADKRSRFISQHYEHRMETAEALASTTTGKPSGSAVDLSGGDELSKDYGVTEAEEKHVGGVLGVGGENDWERPHMEVKSYELSEEVTAPIGNPRKAKKHDRVGYMTSPFRAHIDGRVFRRKMRVRRLEPAGAILLDLSGSMSPSSKLIRRCIEIAPYAVIGAYAGSDAGDGFFTIVARNRKCVSQRTLQEIIEDFGGGNSVDYEALEWLSMQKGPRVWISDGHVCGSGTNESVNISMCFQLAREKEIIRIPDLRMLVGEQPLVNNLRAVVGS